MWGRSFSPGRVGPGLKTGPYSLWRDQLARLEAGSWELVMWSRGFSPGRIGPVSRTGPYSLWKDHLARLEAGSW
jgi:hypothetical protein